MKKTTVTSIISTTLSLASYTHGADLKLPIALYGGINLSDLASSRYANGSGGYETNAFGRKFGIGALVTLNASWQTCADISIQKVQGKKRYPVWIFRGIMMGYYTKTTIHNIHTGQIMQAQRRMR